MKFKTGVYIDIFPLNDVPCSVCGADACRLTSPVLAKNSVGSSRAHQIQRYCGIVVWFTERAEFEFENCFFRSVKDYDEYLRYVYGDYMTPPSNSKR